jgi:hypothetical protein
LTDTVREFPTLAPQFGESDNQSVLAGGEAR